MLICSMDWLEHLIWMQTRWWWNLLLSNNSYTMPQALKASISLKARCKWTMNTLSHLADLFQRPRTARWFQSKYCDSFYTCTFLLISSLFSCRKLLRQLDDLSEQALTPKADHMHRFKTMYALSTKLSKFCFEVFIWRLTLFYTRIQWLMYMCKDTQANPGLFGHQTSQSWRYQSAWASAYCLQQNGWHPWDFRNSHVGWLHQDAQITFHWAIHNLETCWKRQSHG